MELIYRISDNGYPKEKPNYINNENCLKNAVKYFPNSSWHIIADNVSEATNEMIQKYKPKSIIDYVSVGHGAGTFNLALDKALTFEDNEFVYFLENDYLHKPESEKVIIEGFRNGDFVSLYDHKDKYMLPRLGGNPLCTEGVERSNVYLTETCHWKSTNSTTMTFAARVSTLKKSESILRKYTSGTHPYDFEMFLELEKNNYTLVTPLPSYSTHGDVKYLAPLIDWGELVD